jgi:hypothetical protein
MLLTFEVRWRDLAVGASNIPQQGRRVGTSVVRWMNSDLGGLWNGVVLGDAD